MEETPEADCLAPLPPSTQLNKKSSQSPLAQSRGLSKRAHGGPRKRDTVYASHVEVANSVEAFWRVCATHPRLIAEAEEAHEESLTPEERAARNTLRRKRIRAKAEAAMREFEALADWEREDPQKQGDMEMYSEENLVVREELRDHLEVCRELEKWWGGSSAHDDRDKDDRLDHGEYESFYSRLVHLVDPDDDMTEFEIHEAMEEDFKSDAEGGTHVTKDEFVASCVEINHWFGASPPNFRNL